MSTLPAAPAPTHPKVAQRRRISWRRRLAYVLVILGVLVSFMELACYIGTMCISKSTLLEIRHDRESKNQFDASLDLKKDILPAEVSHPYLGWTRNPDANRPDLFEGRKYDPNDFGLMDTGSPLRKRDPNKVIVAVAGGSVGWQMTVSGEDVFLRALQRQPRFQGKQVELVRLAVSGYKQPQQLILLTYLLSLGAEFDILVNIDGYNEVALHPAENAAGDIFPPYPRAWKIRQMDIAKPHQIRLTAQYITSQEQRRNWRRFCSNLPFQSSATVNFLWLVLENRYQKAETLLNMTMIKGRLDHPGYQVLGPRQPFRDADEMYDYLVEYWANCSRQMERMCQANGIEYHHVLPPNQHFIGSKPIVDADETRIALLESEASRAANTGYPMLVKKGRQLSDEGIRFHDLTQLFAQTPEPIYVDNCCHYNPTGNERLALSVAKALGEK